MTEQEWFTANERDLQYAIGKWSARRQRLFAVAVCRAFGKWIDYPPAHAAIEAAEHFADTGKTKAALRRARQSVVTQRDQLFNNRPAGAPLVEGGVGLALFTIQVAASENAVSGTVCVALEALVVTEGVPGYIARRRFYAPYREVAGPEVIPSFDPAWRTDTVLALAKQMYESRDFSAMPILADALQDAGCDSDEILNHCRGKQEGVSGQPVGGSPAQAVVHVRGCWVLDLVLGKE